MSYLPQKIRRKRNLLPKELEGLMGAANHAYAQGNTEDAIKMCMELIKLCKLYYLHKNLLQTKYSEESYQVVKTLANSLLYNVY